jgi:hypothetical protein
MNVKRGRNDELIAEDQQQQETLVRFDCFFLGLLTGQEGLCNERKTGKE